MAALLSLSSVERCLMVGDHQQLRPSIQTHDLKMCKNLHISMFERLVKLGVPAPRLSFQSRMHVDLLDPVLQHYPNLQSIDERVSILQHPEWVRCPLFFWTCESKAELLSGTTSWCNKWQATMAVNLALFLVDQAVVDAGHITILVPYTVVYTPNSYSHIHTHANIHTHIQNLHPPTLKRAHV